MRDTNTVWVKFNFVDAPSFTGELSQPIIDNKRPTLIHIHTQSVAYRTTKNFELLLKTLYKS